VKIRIKRDLYNRAKACADDVYASLYEWSGRAVKLLRTGKLDSVAIPKQSKIATRKGSIVATLFDAKDENELRTALEKAVVLCEGRNPKRLYTPLREGVDYTVEEELE
jgi:hypothetical protein